MRRSSIRFIALAAVAAFAFAACSSSSKGASSSTSPTTTTTASSSPAPSNGGETVSLASSELGQILVDSKGMTLYLDEKDKPGKPACTGSCLTAWPPLAAPATPTFGPGLDMTKFTTVTASDGTKQLAVNGFPLYLWTSDKKAGDTTGQGVNGFYVVGKDYKKIESKGS